MTRAMKRLILLLLSLCAIFPAFSAEPVIVAVQNPLFTELLNAVAVRWSARFPEQKIQLRVYTAEQIRAALNSPAPEFSFLIAEDFPYERKTTTQTLFALAGRLFIVNPGNSLRSMSADELRSVLEGTTTHWNTAAPESSPIHLYLSHPRRVASEKSVPHTLEFITGDAGRTVHFVNQDILSIGVLDLTDIVRRDITVLRAGEVTPSISSALSGKYPFAERYYLYETPRKTALHALIREYLTGADYAAALLDRGCLSLTRGIPSAR